MQLTRIILLAIITLVLSNNLANPARLFAQTPQKHSGIAAAEQALAEGQQLLAEGTATSQHKAVDKFEEAATFWRVLGDKRREGISLSLIGKAYDLLGEKQKALEYYARTLELMRAAGDRSSQAATLNNIGLIYDSLGEKQKALDYYNTAQAILQEVGNRRVQAITLVNIGLVHDSIGEKQKALAFYQRALPLLRAEHDRGSEAVTLNNIGYLYDSIGEQRKALAYLGQALPILREIGERRVEAITLNNIGYVYDGLDEKETALDYYNRALPVLRAIGDRRMEAVTLNNIGLVNKARGDQNNALSFFKQALELRRAVGDRSGESITLSDMGSVYARLGQEQKALDVYQQALHLSRAVQDSSTEASTLRRIALVKRNQGELAEARSYIEDAISIAENLRTRIAGQELRSSYFATVQQFYESFIDILMRLHHLNPKEGYDALALRASERARARTLLDSLTEARANIRQGVSPQLLQRERTLQQKLDIAAERQARLFSGAHTEEQLSALKRETEAFLTEYQEVETEIRASSPRYAALTQPVPLNVEQIQRQVIDTNTLLLEYSLGDEKSYLWAVTPDSIQSFELPPRREIDSATRRVYDLLTARNKHIRFEKPYEQRARVAKADIDFISASTDLSQVLLGPIASQLKDKRLLIISDGGLNYLPFAALPTPLITAPYKPLILEHEIVSLPSASTLFVLRRELRGRVSAPKILAVVADPVFERDDERVKGFKRLRRNNTKRNRSIDVESTNNSVKSFASTRQSNTDEPATIHRLRFTRQEAEEILLLVPPKDRFKALDFDANRTTATSDELGQYRYVHFATHAFLNSTEPELSGIVLSLVNREGAEQDGFLWAHEIYNLHLPAEMVVLSGCRTGLGKEIKGEGLVGLTRGFMYAGSARVVVSLWDISDEASAELMARLYKGILKEYMTPAAALRLAQIELLKDGHWQAPYYWAAFVLQGEPR